MKLKHVVTACALAAAAFAAQANVLVFQGVTFTTTVLDADTLQLEIDAAGRTGDWASAVSIDTIALKNIGSFTTAALTGPGGSWGFSSKELNANGCKGGSSTGNACFTHSPQALGDDMIFTFSFTGGVQNFDLPTLKVRFLNDDGKKQGSLLSMDIPAVPEPETYALMAAGLGAIGFLSRRRRNV